MSDHRLETVFDALAARDRRAVCGYVAATDADGVALDELAEHVASEVGDGDPRSHSTASARRSGSETERETKTRLHHVGLPKLAAADVIGYDPERREVTAGPALSIAVDLVRAAEGDSVGLP